MNKLVKRRYLLELDVWEPLQKPVKKEIDAVMAFARKTISHAGRVHISRLADIPQ